MYFLLFSGESGHGKVKKRLCLFQWGLQEEGGQRWSCGSMVGCRRAALLLQVSASPSCSLEVAWFCRQYQQEHYSLANIYSALQNSFPCPREEPEQWCKPFPVSVGEPLCNTLSQPKGTGVWGKRGKREQEKGLGSWGMA